MAIFYSYVSLPEGTSSIVGTPSCIVHSYFKSQEAMDSYVPCSVAMLGRRFSLEFHLDRFDHHALD